jgi:signal peptidase I
VADAPAPEAPRMPEPVPKNRRTVWLLPPLLFVLAALVLVFFVLYSEGRVDGPSMLPTLRSQDRLLLTKGYPLARRGDIVVFTLEDDAGQKTELVKRVVALAGDTVQVVGDRVWVNGKPEEFKHPVIIGSSLLRIGPGKVPPAHVYVMGDNRPVSEDSRFIGPIPMSDIKGQAVGIFSPVNRIGRIPRPERP